GRRRAAGGWAKSTAGARTRGSPTPRRARSDSPRRGLTMHQLLGLLTVGLLAAPGAIEPKRPNILWIVVDDASANFSCYGEKTIRTPHVDQLAAEGTRFRKAFVTAPVCSPSRSALITGCYQTTIRAHHHRSGRGVEKIRLPKGVEPVPALFQRAGYYTCIGGPPAAAPGQGPRPTRHTLQRD